MGGEGVLKICIWFLKVKRNQWVEIWWAKYCIKSHTYIATVDDFFFYCYSGWQVNGPTDWYMYACMG